MTDSGSRGPALTPAAIARLIDHTLLRPDATRDDIERLCREAVECRFASVCVNPTWIPYCALMLAGSPGNPGNPGNSVALCTVVAFPFGASATEVKVFEARAAIGQGAREIDMVINISRLKSGDQDGVRQDIAAVVSVCHQHRALCKVIIETAMLTDAEKRMACTLALGAQADFVKTSTGFGGGGATVADIQLMRQIVGVGMGIKASGGIRDLATVALMVEAGATRIGTSAGVKIVNEAITAESAARTGN